MGEVFPPANKAIRWSRHHDHDAIPLLQENARLRVLDPAFQPRAEARRRTGGRSEIGWQRMPTFPDYLDSRRLTSTRRRKNPRQVAFAPYHELTSPLTFVR
jgi:hypothetical protein